MTDKIKHIYICFAAAVIALMAVGLSSCRDDYFDSFSGDGSDFVTLQLDYMPMGEAELQTRASVWDMPGEGIADVKDLVLVMFCEDGSFYDLIDLTAESFREEVVDRTDADASNGQLAGETQTKRRTYRLEMQSGRYYLYAAANLGKFGNDYSIQTTTREYLESLGISSMTRDEFRNIRKVWDPSNYRNNSGMTGIFTLGQQAGTTAKTGMEEQTVYVRPGITLHAWLRRMVAKVTVDFDASQLSTSTTIYLKEIRVRDIPNDCSLIEKNQAAHPTLGSPNAAYDSTGGLMSNSRSVHGIRLCNNLDADGNAEQTHVNWPYLTAGIPTLADLADSFDASTPANLKAQQERLRTITHANSAPCLYFYENMQGYDPNKPKSADANNDGIIDSPDSYLESDPDYKDRVPGGTYVEVIAYYHSLEPGNEGEGNIIYRFMLGQNVIDDYNAERNHHYKLTLCFKGYGNDVDWHIEYDRERPPYSMPKEYYVSYGYNEKAEFPITISGELVDDVITAEIVENDWRPYNMWSTARPTTGANSATAYRPYYNGTITKANTADKRDVALGFLSLRKPQEDVIGKSYLAADGVSYLWKDWQGKNDTGSGEYYRTGKTSEALYQNTYYDYYDGATNPYKGLRSLGYRVYEVKTADLDAVGTGDVVYDQTKRAENNETQDGSYRVHTIKSNSAITPRQTTIYVPLYTRQRNLCKTTGYTGENPYDSYQRRAKIRFRFRVKDHNGKIHDCTELVPVIQVAKIGNPMGVWRAWNNASPFHVVLKYPIIGTDQFADLTSHEGGWSAEVEEGADWILLNSGKRKIYGDKGSKIDFTIRPAGVLSSSSQVRCGIVTVRYHNYSCIHKIFVRQGYAPLQITTGGPKWHSFNLVSATAEGESPCDEGSLFRSGNLTQPIAASNNVNDKTPWVNVTPRSWKDHSADKLKIVGGTNTTWDNITTTGSSSALGWPTTALTMANGTTGKIMTLKHIVDLRDGTETKYQFGVLYSDKATETASTLTEAYGYLQSNANKHTYGMRGCFVYNMGNAKQIFFPIGQSGYGKRKHTGRATVAPGAVDAELGYEGNRKEVGSGIVRYSTARITYMKGPATMPLLWDIFRAPGANYWVRKSDNTTDILSSGYRTSLDLNYRTFDFNTLGDELFAGLNGKSDACFIRLVD